MSNAAIIQCPCCGGTGHDAAKTRMLHRREGPYAGRVRCFNCAGNGWDPTQFFRTSTSPCAGDTETPQRPPDAEEVQP